MADGREQESGDRERRTGGFLLGGVPNAQSVLEQTTVSTMYGGAWGGRAQAMGDPHGRRVSRVEF